MFRFSFCSLENELMIRKKRRGGRTEKKKENKTRDFLPLDILINQDSSSKSAPFRRDSGSVVLLVEYVCVVEYGRR